MSNFTKDQPLDGDLILGCAHIRNAGRHHFFKSERGASMAVQDRRTGDNVHPQFAVCCDECFNRAGGDPEGVAWMELMDWVGNEPIIEEPKNED